MNRDYQEGNYLVSERWYRTDRFEIVGEFPFGYEVWAIGRENFPFPGYLPLAKFVGFCMEPGCKLKTIRVDEMLADKALDYAVKYGSVDRKRLEELKKEYEKGMLL